ncbi:MAG: hypothetical protein KC656_21005 [Myxococcales bacterium]|nr:hypothetical protein [Myxococcales bacterium]
MDFTPDGYTGPLSPRPAGLAVGALVLLLGIGAVFAGWLCAGAALVVGGGLTLLNETGTKRIRVTRSKLLMEEESRVRGLLIGPRRSRVGWEETQDVTLEGDCVKLTANDGRVLELGKGGPANELQKLKNRIDQARA